MRSGVPYRHSRRHRSRPLVVRGGLGRTFGGLACFLAVLLICLGVYILDDAFANPVAAQSAAVITAAFSIALGAILLFYLAKPRRSHKFADLEAAGEVLPESPTIQVKVPPAPRKKGRSDLAPRWVYVDPSHISPRPRI